MTTAAVPSTNPVDFLLNVETLDRAINSSELTFTDRLGNAKSTLAAAIDSIKAFNNRGAWASTTYYAGKDLASSGGSWYVCVVPHTSSAAFATDTASKWRLYQGLTLAELNAEIVPYLPAGAGAVPTDVQAVLRESVNVMRFIPVGTNTLTTDCTSYVQTAVDYCAANGWPDLSVPKRIKLSSPVMVDRTVDTTVEEWVIRGTGGGFYTDQPIDMFSSTLTGTNAPLSEFVTFVNVRFSASSDTLDCRVLNGKVFLRMRFSHCYFYKIRCLRTDRYVQSYYFYNCNFRYIKGIFVDVTYNALNGGSSGVCYDLHWTDNIFEKGSLYSGVPTQFLNVATTSIGCSFKGGNYEGNNGPIYKSTESRGVSFSGIYFEENADIDIQLGFSRGSSVKGCMFYTSLFDHWNVSVSGVAFAGSGNATNGKLYYDSMTRYEWSEGITSDGDYAEVQLMYSLPAGLTMGDIGGTVGRKTCQLTGFASSLPIVVTYRKIGRTVTVSWPAVFGTSNSGSMKITGLPAELLPSGSAFDITAPVKDNGVLIMSAGLVNSDGINFYATLGGPGVSAFVSSGAKGVVGNTLTYPI